MIKWIATQAVYVSDQEAAEEFWTNKVGFDVAAARDMTSDLRWLEVGPPNAQSHLVLYPRSLMADWTERQPSIVFECDDVDRTVEELKSRGVEIGRSPVTMAWGKFATFRDPDGNEFGLRS
jgi:lactoylglutathione lyase